MLVVGRFQLPGHAKVTSEGSRSVWFNSEMAFFAKWFHTSDLPGIFSTGPEPMEVVRAEYLRLRNQQQEEQLRTTKESTT